MSGADVLAVMRDHADGIAQAAKLTNKGPRDDILAGLAEFNEAIAVVAELIEAACKAQAMMGCPERIKPRHRQELCAAIARCKVVADPRFARGRGRAVRGPVVAQGDQQ